METKKRAEARVSIPLYKYKSLGEFAYVADIIMNKRFYMTPYGEFNDAVEGKYRTGPHYRRPLVEYKCKSNGREVEERLKRLRVCCFCRRRDNPILWAHCADAFKGVCIEFTVVPQSGSAEHGFTCRRGVTFYPVQCDGVAKMAKSPYYHPSTSESILLHKMPEWSVEDEYRIISEARYTAFGNEIKITRIFLGPRIEPEMKPLWKAVFQMLKDSDEIEVRETKISDKGEVIIE
jgi:hypothetical protein